MLERPFRPVSFAQISFWGDEVCFSVPLCLTTEAQRSIATLLVFLNCASLFEFLAYSFEVCFIDCEIGILVLLT
jgi:hypothetical protein